MSHNILYEIDMTDISQKLLINFVALLYTGTVADFLQCCGISSLFHTVLISLWILKRNV
jgi:hypothetical protein